MVKREISKKIVAKVTIPLGHPNPPESHEVDAAFILARHFNCEVIFIIPKVDYKRKTPDIIMNGVEWEMKSPIGASRATIENQFRRASQQSKNIIIDTRRSSLAFEVYIKSVAFEMKKRRYIKNVLLIDKYGEVVVFEK